MGIWWKVRRKGGRVLLKVVLNAVVYHCVARLSLYAKVDGVSVFWPANGISVVIINSCKTRLEWALALIAVGPAYYWARSSVGSPPDLVLALFCANLAEICIGSFSMRRYLDTSRGNLLDTVGSFKFLSITLGLAGLLGCGVAATIAALSLSSLVGANFKDAWVSWFFGDLAGTYSAIYVLYVVLAYLPVIRRETLQDLKASAASGVGFWLSLLEYCAAISYILAIFAATRYNPIYASPFLLSMFPCIGWIAFRFNQMMSAIVETILMFSAIAFTSLNLGPIALLLDGETTKAKFLTAHMVVLMTTLTADFVAVVRVQRKKFEVKMHQNMEDRLTFFAHISHEFRTPISVMLGFAEEVAGDSTLSAQGKEDISQVIEAAQLMSDFVDDLLDLFRVESAKNSVSVSVVDTTEFFGKIRSLAGKLACPKEITVSGSVELPSHLTFDSNQVKQVLINLISNAVKYTDEGGNIHIDSKMLSPEELADAAIESKSVDVVQFAVKDTGVGIGEEDMEHLFERFFRCKSSIGDAKGTGLGLAIVKRIADNMGATIKVTSEIGEGSTFCLLVPVELPTTPQRLLDTKAFATEPVEDEHLASSPDSSSIGQMQLKVLVAEDSPSNAKLLRRILTSMGHDIVLVGDGLAAVEALKQHSENGKPFHAVMLDLGLPIMTGQEVLSAVRGCTASYRDVPIIVISAHALDDSRRLCKELGANAFTPKPFRREAILRSLQDVIKERMSNAESLSTLSETP